MGVKKGVQISVIKRSGFIDQNHVEVVPSREISRATYNAMSHRAGVCGKFRQACNAGTLPTPSCGKGQREQVGCSNMMGHYWVCRNRSQSSI